MDAPFSLLVDLLGGEGPLRVRSTRPTWSWVVPGAEVQSACRIRVSTEGDGAVVHDSGRLETSRSSTLAHQGSPLVAGRAHRFEVKIWNARNEESPWSSPLGFFVEPDASEVGTSFHDVRPVPEAPHGAKVLPSGNFLHDFGTVRFAGVRVALGKGRGRLTVHLGEKLREDGQGVDRTPPGTVRYRSIVFDASEELAVVPIPADERNTGSSAVLMPREIGEVLPFRWVEIEGAARDLEGIRVERTCAETPFDVSAASFDCDDDVLNRTWELCRHTIRATTFCGVYVDGDRERIPYEADAYLNQLSHYAVDREWAIGRRTWEWLMTKPTWPTEWILFSVLMAWLDYEHTGDERPLAGWYERLEAKALLGLAGEDGLISTKSPLLTDALMDAVGYGADRRGFTNHGLRDLVDWPPASFTKNGIGERDGYEMVDVNTVVNAFHAHALDRMAKIASVLGRADSSEVFLARKEKVLRALNERCWNAETGAYADGVGTSHCALHASLFPLAFGLVPEERKASVIRHVRSRGMACSVYAAQFLLDGLFENGEEDFALGLVTAPGDRSWRHMLDSGATLTWEAWDLVYKNNLDWNHAWGAAPANLFPRHVLGVRPLRPAHEEFLVAPRLGPLKRASGKVPTIRGFVEVDVRRASAAGEERFRLDVTVPGNTQARLSLPENWRARGSTPLFLAPGRHVLEGSVTVPS